MYTDLQKKIVKVFEVKNKINPKKEFLIRVNFLKNYLKKYQSIKKLILGVSGGQDSALMGKICQESINELKNETKRKSYKFIATYLPYGNKKDKSDYQDIIEFIKPDRVIEINIKSAVDSSIFLLEKSGIITNNYIKGNIKSRERMKIQYGIANSVHGIVIGTCNAAEATTGFFTKYGDSGTDINPLIQLNKRQVKCILKYLKCPKHILHKEPSADLEDDSYSIPDKEILGVSYKDIDDYLEGKIVNEKSKNIIESLYKRTEHKRKTLILTINFQKY